MAALCTSHSFHTESYQNRIVRSRNRAGILRLMMSCRQQSQEPEKEERQGRMTRRSLSRMISDVEKIGKELKERLRPEKKGDWKDLVLMSLSFAVYVYISQQIVCAYFAWMSIPRPSW